MQQSTVMVKEIEIIEFEWYLRDHLFRQSNQGKEKFQKDQLGKEMSHLLPLVNIDLRVVKLSTRGDYESSQFSRLDMDGLSPANDTFS